MNVIQLYGVLISLGTFHARHESIMLKVIHLALFVRVSKKGFFELDFVRVMNGKRECIYSNFAGRAVGPLACGHVCSCSRKTDPTGSA